MLISAFSKRIRSPFSSSSSSSLALYNKSRHFSIMPHQRNQFFDITSDTATEPTDDMFDIMKTASRGDDVFGVCKHETNKYLYCYN